MLGRPYFTVQNSVYCSTGGACWAAGQSGAQGPVMCGAGLHVRCWGAVLVSWGSAPGRFCWGRGVKNRGK